MNAGGVVVVNRIEVVVDTDLGTDVDDLQALLVVLGAPGFTLRAVTVSYGDTRLRSRLARRLLDLAGRPEIDVHRGFGQPMSDVPVFWMGHEGRGVPGVDTSLDDSVVGPLADGSPVLPDLTGSHLLAIAPLTTAARFLGGLDRTPPISVAVMGGDFDGVLGDEAEHNFACDPVAAAAVARSMVATTYCGFEQTSRTRAGMDVATALEGAGPLGRLAGDQMRRWWKATEPESEMFPHDAVTALTMIHPEFFQFEHGVVEVEPRGRLAGRSVFHPEATSSTRRVVDMDIPLVEAAVRDYMLAACLAVPVGADEGSGK